jgi:hypothetical protein
MSTDNPHAGGKSGKINVLTHLELASYKPKLIPGASYRFSFWARAEKPIKILAHVRTAKPPYQFLGSQNVEVGSAWKEYTTEFSVPKEYTADDNVLLFNFPEGSVCWIDDVSFEKK